MISFRNPGDRSFPVARMFGRLWAPAPPSCGESLAGSRRLQAGQWTVALGLVLLFCGLRLMHLAADTPPWVEPTSTGAYVDEGYKTLSPRNLAVFGATHWHPRDDYPGWMKVSPVTNWTYYLAFRVTGANIETARCVTILCFAVFLLLYLWVLQERYSFPVLLAGLLILGLDGTLFFFTRIALIEGPEILFLYGGLFLLARAPKNAVWGPVVGTFAFAPVLAFGIKLSAFVYLSPIILALLVRAAVLRGIPRSRILLGGAAAAAAVMVALIVVTTPVWSARLKLDPVIYVSNVLSSPLMRVSPFLFLTGWLCMLHLLVCRPAQVLASSYRTAVLAVALLGPFVLALFPYNPPRYYIPLLPAYALAICEWLAVGAWRFAVPRKSWIVAAVGVSGGAIFLFSVVRVVNYDFLGRLPLNQESQLRLSDFDLILVAFLPSLLLAGAIWFRWIRLMQGRLVAKVVLFCAALFTLQTVIRLGDFAAAPRFEGRTVRARIVESVPPGSSVIGAWAPFFALGTDLRALYMSLTSNVVSRVTELCPEYFLHCDTPQSRESLKGFGATTSAHLGPPLMVSEYNGTKVVLYPIKYATETTSGKADAVIP